MIVPKQNQARRKVSTIRLNESSIFDIICIREKRKAHDWMQTTHRIEDLIQ